MQAALSGYVKIKYQAEDPDEPPAKTVMQRFNAAGLPTYVILRPRSRSSGLRGSHEMRHERTRRWRHTLLSPCDAAIRG